MPADILARDFGWRHAGRKRAALAHIDLEVPAGQRVLLAGASGAGKSTFLHALAGVLPAESGYQEGELLVGGQEPDPSAGRTGLVLQDPDSQVILATIGADVAFGMENLRVPAADIPHRAAAALDLVGLTLPPERSTQALSGGQKQRLAIAGVIAMAPDVIVLDEPTANLDPAAVTVVRDAVLAAQARTGATMLVVEHRVEIWADHVDRVVVLGPEGVLADGPPRAVLADAGLRPALLDAGLWLPDLPLPAPRARAAGGEELLSARGLGTGRGRALTAAGIDLDIRASTATGFVGPNGAGKSTTALTLAGLLPPLAGTLRAQPALLAAGTGRPRGSAPHGWSAQELVSRIGTVFQEPEHQFIAASVRAELEFGPLRAGLGEEIAAARADELLARLRMEALAPAHPQTLSGGEKRRLSVACMLAAQPPVLIVDEPTFGQDARTWRGLAELLGDQVDAGGALLAVSHDEEFLTAVGARRCAFAPAPRPQEVR
ncbi:ATP-binding cassette domain-containing protein [Brevibacterium sp. BRM-1]|uniref:ABC transporter ATP-binding protein n=1 Tax=Brevibacterium sp. BRM-1 TaxID=2999062 RepID=UPI0022815BDD|nr:ATP-binding cassette domain-containing protein [Brevibacterium sp. BRM-1]WAL39081.1 ATP-binding cassette domain-containing protein [Brevibacterium sp. BRM-1]